MVTSLSPAAFSTVTICSMIGPLGKLGFSQDTDMVEELLETRLVMMGPDNGAEIYQAN